MYRQVEVREQDRKYQKFLYRNEESGKLHEHQHNMVTFGVTSATYLAVKSLQQLAHLERKNFPQAAEVIRRDFYMDDGMSGADTEQMCEKLCKDVKELLAKGTFELSKFISNCEKVLESIPEKDREIQLPLEIDLSNTVKTLGIHYHPTLDDFQFKVKLTVTKKHPTKRSLLFETSRLYDPLGWLAPVIIRAKILFLGLWEAGLTWDEELPKHIAETWVAPLKRETIPRLELCGLVLLVNLMAVVHKALLVPDEKIHAWTDSVIVLGWLNTNPAGLKTYVANRVVEVNNDGWMDG